MRVLFHLKLLVIGVIGGAILFALSVVTTLLGWGVTWCLAWIYSGSMSHPTDTVVGPIVYAIWLTGAAYLIGRCLERDLPGLG